MPLVVENWSPPNWLINEDDSCTQLALSAITYPAGSASVAANRTMAMGGGSTTGYYENVSGGVVNFNQGQAQHYFSAPGAGNTGKLATSINLNALPWLQYDWDNNGSYNDNKTPNNNVNFGAYRGHDRIIFWQEN